MQPVAAVALCLLALMLIARLARGGGPYRQGPWPGLTPRGGGLLLAHALLLAGALLLAPGDLDAAARGALPYLPLATAASVATLVLAARLTGAPGAGAAVCGAYLLPRGSLSLLAQTLAPPPMLVAAAVLFELALWLRWYDLVAVLDVWPARARGRVWRQRPWRSRAFSPRRALVAGGVFGSALALLEPPIALLLGGDPSKWPPDASAAAVPLSAATGAAAAWLAGSVSSRVSCRCRGTAR